LIVWPALRRNSRIHKVELIFEVRNLSRKRTLKWLSGWQTAVILPSIVCNVVIRQMRSSGRRPATVCAEGAGPLCRYYAPLILSGD
jgi:hypothetical protein